MEPVVINGITLQPYTKQKMSLPKWKREDVRWEHDENGYNFIAVETEQEAYELKSKLRSQKLCAQAGYTVNKDGYIVIFVMTKKRGHKRVQTGSESSQREDTPSE